MISSNMKGYKFTFPDTPLEHELISVKDQKVMVVSILGKSEISSRSCKGNVINTFSGYQLFPASVVDDPSVNEDTFSEIDGYYDCKNKIIFLHLRGVYDTSTISKVFDFISKDLEDKSFLSIWAKLKHSCAKYMLFLFIVSHIIVFSNPGHSFDVSCIHLFRSIDNARQKLLTHITDTLRTIPGIPKEWQLSGRPCSPRVLFLFETCPSYFQENFKYDVDDHSATDGSKGKSGKRTLKRLEYAIEDQIYRILRKSRIITNNSAHSLFTVPANQEFVYISTKSRLSHDVVACTVNSLIDFCKDPSSEAHRYKDDVMEDSFILMEKNSSEHSFKDFLQQHIDQGFCKGFDDRVGRHTAASHFEIPSVVLWFDVANKLFKLFSNEAKCKTGFNLLHTMIDTDMRFSEGRCGKVLPLATAAYQESLPPHYTRDYHERKLAHALSVFAIHARGPLFEQYTLQLEKDCDRFWKNGKQMCEVLSLTGNPCTNPLHRGGGDGAGGGELQGEGRKEEGEEWETDLSQLPLMEHSSGVRYVSSCNCGRKQGPREDPFSVRAANYDFYQKLGKECGCSDLESFKFPVFQPSTKDYKAAQLFSNSGKLAHRSADGRELNASTPQSSTQGFSFVGFVSGHSGGSDVIQEETDVHLSPNIAREHSSADGNEIIIQVSEEDSELEKEKALVRQPSTTEYLPGMVHADSPSGLLPQFPSWSLVCLGPSSLYSHNLGLQDQQQAGLLGGSAFLLPWDVTVRLEHHSRDRWPTVADQYRNKYQTSAQQALLRGRKPKGGSKEFVVKIFVGVEYECPRGHRFMCSAPDKVLKTIGSGIVKDNGNKVTSNDMPLYFPCPCRANKPLIAQLMRVHVVTPKAPVHVTLNPRVQPAPSPCPIFVTGCEQALRLSQSAYWVLRLPYVYMGEHGPYMAPKEPVASNYGRLLGGMYGITEVAIEDK